MSKTLIGILSEIKGTPVRASTAIKQAFGQGESKLYERRLKQLRADELTNSLLIVNDRNSKLFEEEVAV